MISHGGLEGNSLESTLFTTFRAYTLTELGAILSQQARLAQEIADLNLATDAINAGVAELRVQLGDVRSELDLANAIITESVVDASVMDALTAAVDRAQATAEALQPVAPIEPPVTEEPGTDPAEETPVDEQPELPFEEDVTEAPVDEPVTDEPADIVEETPVLEDEIPAV